MVRRLFTALFLLAITETASAEPSPEKVSPRIEDTRPIEVSRSVEVIPLHVSEREPGTYRPEVDVVIDGHSKRFILDTGARKTSVFSDEDTQVYPVIGKDQSGGASGKVDTVDIIQPQKLQMGPHIFLTPHLQRTRAHRKINVLGMDLLAENPFQVDFKNARLSIINGIATELVKEPIHTLSDGHITIPTALGKKLCFALFDTGAEQTTVDLQFVKSNANLFKFVRANRGIDSLGQNMDTPVYRVDSLKAGNLQLTNVEMVTFDYGDALRKKMEGVPIILGSNVMYHAKWSLDVQQGVWAVEPY